MYNVCMKGKVFFVEECESEKAGIRIGPGDDFGIVVSPRSRHFVAGGFVGAGKAPEVREFTLKRAVVGELSVCRECRNRCWTGPIKINGVDVCSEKPVT